MISGLFFVCKAFLMRKILSLLFIITLIGCSSGNVTVSDLRDGDLLFVVNGLGNNITDVTEGVDGLMIDHVAIYAGGDIIEAVPDRGVWRIPLDSFIVRLAVTDAVLVGRVDGLNVGASIRNAERFLGSPYDDIFMPNDSALYCSELVQKSFVFKDKSDDGVDEGLSPHAVFSTIPMSFHDSTGNVTEFWTKFYASRGLSVPEGAPGTNPGQLSRDPNVKLLGYLRFGTSTSSVTEVQ